MARWTRATRTTHADRKYMCREHEGHVFHDPKCRKDRPLCKWRRAGQTCRCNAAEWPHRAGSLAGCRAGGIPDVILKSRSYQEQQAVMGEKKRWGTRRRTTTRARKRW